VDGVWLTLFYCAWKCSLFHCCVAVPSGEWCWTVCRSKQTADNGHHFCTSYCYWTRKHDFMWLVSFIGKPWHYVTSESYYLTKSRFHLETWHYMMTFFCVSIFIFVYLFNVCLYSFCLSRLLHCLWWPAWWELLPFSQPAIMVQ